MLAIVRLYLIRITIFAAAAALPEAIAQTQYSIGNPTNEQQYMLELINRARANGGAEANRLQGWQSDPLPEQIRTLSAALTPNSASTPPATP